MTRLARQCPIQSIAGDAAESKHHIRGSGTKITSARESARKSGDRSRTGIPPVSQHGNLKEWADGEGGNFLRRDPASGDQSPQLSEVLLASQRHHWAWRPPSHRRSRKRWRTKPRTPVMWLHGLECTCCSESFIRSAHPLVKDVVLSMISPRLRRHHHGGRRPSGRGHPRGEHGTNTRASTSSPSKATRPSTKTACTASSAASPFVEQLREVCPDAKAMISWGSCASWGCVQAAKPNPTRATPVHKVIPDKPIIKVPGCPPIAEVMTGRRHLHPDVRRIPELDRQGRPEDVLQPAHPRQMLPPPAFRRRPVRRAVGRRERPQGLLPLQDGLQGPTTYNACSTTRWNNGVSFPIQSGHGCIGCSEDGFWDNGPFYDRLTNVKQFGIEANADQIGGTVAAPSAPALPPMRRQRRQARPHEVR